MTNPIIENDVTEVLKKLDGRFDKLENKIEIGQGRIEEKLISQEKIVQKLETSQKNQIWVLIILAFTPVASLSGAFGKILVFP